MKSLPDNHIFKIDDRCHLVLIDKTGAASGEYLKAIKFRNPNVLVDLKTVVKNNEINLGQIINVGDYYFVVGRKHFRSKWDLKAIEEGLSKFDEKYELKSLDIDYPEEVIELFNNIPNFEWRNKYEWGKWLVV